MMRWIQQLKHWWLRRQYLRVKLSPAKLTDPMGSRKTLQTLLGFLDSSRFAGYTRSQGIGVPMVVFYKTIDEYLLELKSMNVRLVNDQMVQTAWADQTERATTLDQFLISKDGFYLDSAQAIESFKKEALILCALIQKGEDAKIGIHAHNQRMLARFVLNLHAVTKKLIDVSHSLLPEA